MTRVVLATLSTACCSRALPQMRPCCMTQSPSWQHSAGRTRSLRRLQLQRWRRPRLRRFTRLQQQQQPAAPTATPVVPSAPPAAAAVSERLFERAAHALSESRTEGGMCWWPCIIGISEQHQSSALQRPSSAATRTALTCYTFGVRLLHPLVGQLMASPLPQ